MNIEVLEPKHITAMTDMDKPATKYLGEHNYYSISLQFSFLFVLRTWLNTELHGHHVKNNSHRVKKSNGGSLNLNLQRRLKNGDGHGDRNYTPKP